MRQRAALPHAFQALRTPGWRYRYAMAWLTVIQPSSVKANVRQHSYCLFCGARGYVCFGGGPHVMA